MGYNYFEDNILVNSMLNFRRPLTLVEHLFAIGLYATIIISRTCLRLGDAN